MFPRRQGVVWCGAVRWDEGLRPGVRQTRCCQYNKTDDQKRQTSCGRAVVIMGGKQTRHDTRERRRRASTPPTHPVCLKTRARASACRKLHARMYARMRVRPRSRVAAVQRTSSASRGGGTDKGGWTAANAHFFGPHQKAAPETTHVGKPQKNDETQKEKEGGERRRLVLRSVEIRWYFISDPKTHTHTRPAEQAGKSPQLDRQQRESLPIKRLLTIRPPAGACSPRLLTM